MLSETNRRRNAKRARFVSVQGGVRQETTSVVAFVGAVSPSRVGESSAQPPDFAKLVPDWYPRDKNKMDRDMKNPAFAGPFL